MDPAIAKARELWRDAEYVTVLTGAGVSAESGVPTFRGNEGLWRSFRAEELATPEAFAKNPKLVWEWYLWRRGDLVEKTPNPGHLAIMEMQNIKIGFQLITQNVDDLHAEAGNTKILELHGNIWRVRCSDCGRKREDRRIDMSVPPRCEACEGLIRPDIVWFGETLDRQILSDAFRAAKTCDLFILAGTSSLVYPAAYLAGEAKQHRAAVIEINLEATPNTDMADVFLRGKSGDMLPALLW